MTIQQEAYQLIDTLPEDSIIIVQLMHKLKTRSNAERKELRFSDYVIPTEWADHTEEYV